MNSIRTIRKKLGITQAALAQGIGVTQGNISHYEKGQTVPPRVARDLIKYANAKGLLLTFDQIYTKKVESERLDLPEA